MLNLKCFQLKAVFLPVLGSEWVFIFHIYVFADEYPFLDCQGGALEPSCRGSPGFSNVSISSTITVIMWSPQWPSVQFSSSVMSNSLRPHGLQQTRLPCPSPTVRVYSNSSPLNQWGHPAISSSVIPFSSCLQSFAALGSFPMSHLFTSGGQVLKFQLQHQSFQWIFRIDFL